MFGAEHEHNLDTSRNSLFIQNINDICAVCLQQHEHHRTSSMQDMLSAQDKIEVYKILESISLFKYSVKTPQLLCATCSFKLLNIYEFQQMCNKSYSYLNNYINQQDTQDADARHVETDTESKPFIEEVGDNHCLQGNVLKHHLIDVISESFTFNNEVSNSTNTLPLTNEKNDVSGMEDPDAEGDACKIEIEDTIIRNLCSDSEGSIKSIQKSFTEIQASTELTFLESSNLKDRHSKEHLECSIDLNKDVQHFKCTFCSAIFTSNQSLCVPKYAYTEGRQFKCNQCGQTSAMCYSLKEHTEIHPTEQLFSCEVCAKQFKEEHALTSHMVTHTSECFQNADKISWASDGTTKVSQESEIVSAGTIEGDGVINKSKRTDHQAGATAELTEHGAHPKGHLGLDKKASCNDARKGRSTEFVCKYCNKVLSKKRCLIAHENLHTGEKPFKCHQCPRAYSSSQSLDYHKVTHDLERRFCCKHCGKAFQHKRGLTQHLVSHTNARTHVCSICNKGFNFKLCLMTHMQSHNSQDDKTSFQKFTCDQCPRAYVTRSALTYHKLNHKPERPFVCDICAKTFKHRGILNLHMKRHANARSYVCSMCGKGFNVKSNLTAHMRRKHNNGDNDNGRNASTLEHQ